MAFERHIFPASVSDVSRKAKAKPDSRIAAPPSVKPLLGSGRNLRSAIAACNDGRKTAKSQIPKRMCSPPMEEICSNFEKEDEISCGDADSQLKELEVASSLTSDGISRSETSFGDSSTKRCESDGESNESGVEMQSFIIRSLDAADIGEKMSKAAQDLNLELQQEAANKEGDVFYDSTDQGAESTNCFAEGFWKELSDRAAQVNGTLSAKVGFCSFWKNMVFFLSVLLACMTSLFFAIYLKVKLEGLDSGPPPT